MAKKKKVLTAAVAVATAAALVLGGTFAWQSINQTALNESEAVVNPGGRLHDDFYIDANGDYNSDIYVENFADEDIYARVQLREFMELYVNYGTAAQTDPIAVVGSRTGEEATPQNPKAPYSYDIHYFDKENATDAYWTWYYGDMSSEAAYYMPTFNLNKDSQVADRNGMYVDRVGGISNRGQSQYDYTEWSDGDPITDTAIYDYDSNMDDEVGYNFDNLSEYEAAGNVALKSEEHIASAIGDSNGLISMSEWLNKLENGEDTADYWVYDTDGWVYWSSPIAAGTTTGRLLDSIELNEVMDDTWYYAIDVIGQFVTADSIGKSTGTGFYTDDEDAPSSYAERLLDAIVENVNEEGGEVEPETDNSYLHVYVLKDIGGAWDNASYCQIGEEYKIVIDMDWYGEGDNGYDTAVSMNLSAVSYDGTEISLRNGEDYELTFPSGTFTEDGVTDDDYLGGDELYLVGTLKLKEAVPYGAWITLDAWTTSAEVRGSGSNRLVVADGVVEIEDVVVTLYDANGNPVEDGFVDEDTTYDVVAKINYGDAEYTVFSSDENQYALSKNIEVYGENFTLHTYDFEEGTDRDGEYNDGKKICVGKNDKNLLGELTASVTIGNLQLLDDTGETVKHLYVYGEGEWWFEGEYPLDNSNDYSLNPETYTSADWYFELEEMVYVVNVSESREISLSLVKNSEGAVADAVYTIVSEVSNGTAINGNKLTVAEGETASIIKIHVSSESCKGQGYLYIALDWTPVEAEPEQDIVE